MNNDKNKLEKFLPEFMAASFISKKVTASTIALINQFSRYFRDIRTQRQFYLDMLCLHLDIFHRLGAGLIKKDTHFESIPSAELVDERIGMISGMCVRLIEEHSKKFPFMGGIDLESLRDSYRKFHNWSVEFKKIYDKRNALSVKFVSKQIVGFSIKGDVMIN